MQCPACGHSLRPIKAGDITLDACAGGCGGVWFDQLELKRLDEQHEALGNELLNLPVDAARPVNLGERRHCPRCIGQVMLRFFYSPQRKVTVDHCPNCGGHWLDAGELRAIRETFTNDAQRDQAIDRLIDDSFGNELERMEAEREKRLKARRPLRRIFGFLLPRS